MDLANLNTVQWRSGSRKLRVRGTNNGMNSSQLDFVTEHTYMYAESPEICAVPRPLSASDPISQRQPDLTRSTDRRAAAALSLSPATCTYVAT